MADNVTAEKMVPKCCDVGLVTYCNLYFDVRNNSIYKHLFVVSKRNIGRTMCWVEPYFLTIRYCVGLPALISCPTILQS